MSHPLVSIVVPTRNRADLLRDCLRSLLAQDYPHDRYEVIVVDDGSTDIARPVVESFRIGEVAVRYKRTRVPGLNDGCGPNVARNVGIRASRGELVAFVDDDVIAPPSWLSSMVAESRAPVELVYGPVKLSSGISLPSKHREESVYVTEALEPPIPIFCNVLMHRTVLRRGAPSEQWRPPAEEIEWLRRVRPVTRFAPIAFVIHQKTPEDLHLGRLARTAWGRGCETGRFARRAEGKRIDEIARAVATGLRALGHAMLTRCWGGALVALSRAGFVWGWLRG